MVRRLVYIILVLSLQSCFIQEQVTDPVAPFDLSVSLDYEEHGQIFYSLEERKVLATNSIYDWDLAFDCRPGHFNIIVNVAKGMAAFNTDNRDFYQKYIQQAYPWRYDHPCGDLSLTCIGDWGDFTFENPQSFERTYVINLGQDHTGLSLGLKKFKVHGYTDGHYLVQFADLDNSNDRTFFIKKDPKYNFTYLSFRGEGAVVDIEPPKEEWDIMFSPYIDSLKYENQFIQRINDDLGIFDGILHNRHNRLVAIERNLSFDEINLFSSNELQYSRFTNTIGNRWIDWDPRLEQYVLTEKNKFILRNEEDDIYLIEFLGMSKSSKYRSTIQLRMKNL